MDMQSAVAHAIWSCTHHRYAGRPGRGHPAGLEQGRCLPQAMGCALPAHDGRRDRHRHRAHAHRPQPLSRRPHCERPAHRVLDLACAQRRRPDLGAAHRAMAVDWLVTLGCSAVAMLRLLFGPTGRVSPNVPVLFSRAYGTLRGAAGASSRGSCRSARSSGCTSTSMKITQDRRRILCDRRHILRQRAGIASCSPEAAMGGVARSDPRGGVRSALSQPAARAASDGTADVRRGVVEGPRGRASHATAGVVLHAG
jgi:hypothetical protein